MFLRRVLLAGNTRRVMCMSTASSNSNNNNNNNSNSSKVNERSTTAMEYKQQNPRQLRRLPRVDLGSLAGSPSAEQAVSNILYNTPISPKLQTERHILDCLAQDEPGVLSRVTGIMAARGFNIDSLVASKTEVPGLSRMTLVLKGPAIVMEQAKKQLEDLVPIWAVLDYGHTRIIERESLLAKVSLTKPDEADFMDTQERLKALRQLTELFKGEVLDVSQDSAVVSVNAKSDRIDAFLKLVRPFGIHEAVRSGIMAMPRSGDMTLFESEMSAPQVPVDRKPLAAGPDLSNLPPS